LFYAQIREFMLAHPDATRGIHYHDWTIYALARTWGKKWIFDPRSFMLYRQHAGNDTGARASFGGVIKRLKLIRTGWYSRQLRSICAACRVANPAHSVVSNWHELLCLPVGSSRKLRMIDFCLQGGRRRRSDNAVLLCAVAAGWI
jgi:rhamnosyltransferase